MKLYRKNRIIWDVQVKIYSVEMMLPAMFVGDGHNERFSIKVMRFCARFCRTCAHLVCFEQILQREKERNRERKVNDVSYNTHQTKERRS